MPRTGLLLFGLSVVSMMILSLSYSKRLLPSLLSSSSRINSSTKLYSALGATTTDISLSKEAISKFVKGDVTFAPTTGGVNNIVQYCESDGKKYVLRIYNNGRNSVRVNWEHEVLTRLNAVGPFSFKIPTTIPSLDKNTFYVPLSNGAEACLFELIPGKLPKLTCVRDIGRASGELVTKLEKVEMPSNLKSPNAPYYDIYKVHHATTAANFREYTKSSIFDDIRVWIELLVKEINEIEAKCNSKEYLSLPKQLIHGDLHYDNVLCDNGKVSGLLDFEFSAIDWRAMELAICLSKYAAEKEALSYFEEFVDGFVEHGKLTRKEVEAIPDLINLRVLSNVVYFVGRAIAEEDNISSLLTRAETYSKRVTWIKDNKDNIINLIEQKMKPKMGQAY